MNEKFAEINGVANSDQLVNHLRDIPASTSQIIDLVKALNARSFWGVRRDQIDHLVYLEEVWMGAINENLVGRFDLSFRRLAPLVIKNSKEVIGKIDLKSPFDLVAAKLRLIPSTVVPLDLSFGTGQQYEIPEKRPWIASFTLHQSQQKTATTAVKNISLPPEVLETNSILLERIKTALNQNSRSTNPEWITMNGW